MADRLTPENYKRLYEWDQLPYDVRAKAIDSLSARLALDKDLVSFLDKAIKADQNWWVELPFQFQNEVQYLLDQEVSDQVWGYHLVSAIQKAVENITESGKEWP